MPTWIFITERAVGIIALNYLPVETGVYDEMDKGYVEFKRLLKKQVDSATRIKRVSWIKSKRCTE